MTRSKISVTSYRARDLSFGDVCTLRVFNVDKWVQLTADAIDNGSAGYVTLKFMNGVGKEHALEVPQFSLIRVQVEKET